jgi:WD40 repeat protein
MREWDPVTGRETRERPLSGEVNLLAMAPDGSRIVTVREGGEAQLWLPGRTDPTPIASPQQVRPVDVAWSPDSQRFAVAFGDGPLIVIDRDGGHQQRIELRFADTGLGPRLAWLEQDRVAANSAPGSIHIVDLRSRTSPTRLNGDPAALTALTATGDGTRLAAATTAGSVRIWDTQTAGELAAFDHPEPIVAVAFVADDRLRSMTASGRILDSTVGEGAATEVARVAPAAIAAFGPAGERLLTIPGSTLREPEAASGAASDSDEPRSPDRRRSAAR